MKDYFMKVCTLKKGTLVQTLWMPEKFAVKGKILKLKDDDGWVVDIVSKIKVPQKYVDERSRDYKRTREASDI